MRRYRSAALLYVFTASAMAQSIFLTSVHPTSKRSAVLEDDSKVAYLYLTAPGTQRPEKDAIVYSRVPPVSKVDWEQIKQTGTTPMLRQDIASSTAVLVAPQEREFSFKWSRDGNSVAVLRSGTPMAFATMSERFGYSKAVSVSSPLANAWDQSKYTSLFAE